MNAEVASVELAVILHIFFELILYKLCVFHYIYFIDLELYLCSAGVFGDSLLWLWVEH